jgi:hypothetical protein
MTEVSASPPPEVRRPQQGPTLIDVINVLADKADPVVKLLEAAVTGYQKGKERQIRFQIHLSWIAIAVVAVIVGTAAALTWKGRIDGSTFTFLLGLIVGYVLTFVRDQITGPE